jgi:hypothetical protein
MSANERWPHPSIVANELKAIRKEMRTADWLAKRAHYDEMRGRLKGDDYDMERIMRRLSVAVLTSRMMKIGERIANELAENGREVRD